MCKDSLKLNNLKSMRALLMQAKARVAEKAGKAREQMSRSREKKS